MREYLDREPFLSRESIFAYPVTHRALDLLTDHLTQMNREFRIEHCKHVYMLKQCEIDSVNFLNLDRKSVRD